MFADRSPSTTSHKERDFLHLEGGSDDEFHTLSVGARKKEKDGCRLESEFLEKYSSADRKRVNFNDLLVPPADE